LIESGSKAQLDFIEKSPGSAFGVAVKDWFVAEHFVCPLEGEPERSEVTEGAPASLMADQ
jgi:hypothetical protein